jgi:hypothetical protein
LVSSSVSTIKQRYLNWIGLNWVGLSWAGDARLEKKFLARDHFTTQVNAFVQCASKHAGLQGGLADSNALIVIFR